MSKSSARTRSLAYEIGQAAGLLDAALPLVRNARARAYVEKAKSILTHVVEREEPAPRARPRIASRANSTAAPQGED